jgi:hypothetical protein
MTTPRAFAYGTGQIIPEKEIEQVEKFKYIKTVTACWLAAASDVNVTLELLGDGDRIAAISSPGAQTVKAATAGDTTRRFTTWQIKTGSPHTVLPALRLSGSGLWPLMLEWLELDIDFTGQGVRA